MTCLKQFAKWPKPSSDVPIPIVLDTYYSHVSLEAYIFCRGNNIVILSFQHISQNAIARCCISWHFKNCFLDEMWFVYKKPRHYSTKDTVIRLRFRKEFLVSKHQESCQLTLSFFGKKNFFISDYLLGNNIDLFINNFIPNTFESNSRNKLSYFWDS